MICNWVGASPGASIFEKSPFLFSAKYTSSLPEQMIIMFSEFTIWDSLLVFAETQNGRNVCNSINITTT